jgi:hypothetical protein
LAGRFEPLPIRSANRFELLSIRGAIVQDLNRQPDQSSEPKYPAVVTIAGIIWIVDGCVIGLIMLVLLLLLFGFPALFPPESLLTFLFSLFIWPFIGVGDQSVRGTARSTVVNGIASILFGIFILGPCILAVRGLGWGNIEASAGWLINCGVGLLGGPGLISAGILWLVGLNQYRAWRRSHRVRIRAALAALLRRRSDSFVIFEDKQSGKFVQFAGPDKKERLLLDLPFASLDAEESRRAEEHLPPLGVRAVEYDFLDRPGGIVVGHTRSFGKDFGRNVEEATRAALEVFDRVYQLPPDFDLVVTEN